jgi:hypothetical protein
MNESVLEKIKKLVPNELKYDYVHLRNFRKYQKEINKVDKKEGNQKEYTYTIKNYKKNRCIFVHIPRAAGSSISSAIFRNSGGGHRTVETYRTIFGRKFWSYYKFSFIRNPYTRLVSAYEYLESGGHPAWPSNQMFHREVLESYDGFSDFVLNWLRPDRSGWPVPHFRPQVDFLKLGSEIPLDFIGCVEKVEEDFNSISEKLGIDRKLPRKNETPKDKKPIKKYFTSRKVKEKVDEFYREDFERLGYSRRISESDKEPDIRGKFR